MQNSSPSSPTAFFSSVLDGASLTEKTLNGMAAAEPLAALPSQPVAAEQSRTASSNRSQEVDTHRQRTFLAGVAPAPAAPPALASGSAFAFARPLPLDFGLDSSAPPPVASRTCRK